MNQYVVIVVFFAPFFGTCIGLPHSAAQISNFKFSIWSFRNKTGYWMAKVLMGHDANDKDLDPIAVTVDHEAKKFEDHEEIVINVTAIASPNNTADIDHAVLKKPAILPGPGYKLLEGLGYYKIYPNGAANSWKFASNICEVDGGHLLVLNSNAEANGINYLISQSKFGKYWFWIGFHDLYVEGRYVTVFNESLTAAGYLEWAPREPLTGPNDNCGYYKKYMGLGTGGCTFLVANIPFICEIITLGFQ